ncbi:hypothetical protein CAL26_04980 [Bordetella genomosp. 9]|uniref:DUF551 domain-containing protein n=1 Tax=Bordetella genomosp. 9 TaxID=1416803 RepID=A0A261RNN5_9BORD|nr:hypothetical protein [Bordetella genomosp. 9]OZI26678.1 hypothetical protein CAL26_04980 [Bordetella genomosp. 9]
MDSKEQSTRAEAWKAFALHQTWCSACAESVATCDEGMRLRDAAIELDAQPQQPPKIDVEHLIRTVLPGGYSVDPQAVADDLRRYSDAWEPQQPAEPPFGYAYLLWDENDCIQRIKFSTIQAHEPFGVAGKDFDRSFLVTCVPLYEEPQQPAGWEMVPVEPTDEMVSAGCQKHTCVQQDPWYSDEDITEEDCKRIYAAMLAAAPAHPSQQEDAVRPDADWVQGPYIAATGRGWCARIDGTDIFSDLNRHGCKGRITFEIAGGLPSREAAEQALRDWLSKQIAAMSDSAREGGKNG